MKKNFYFILFFQLALLLKLAGLESVPLLPIGDPLSSLHAVAGESNYRRDRILWLDDNSFWLIYPLEKRKQTWSERWNNITPLENQFDARFYLYSAGWPTGTPVYIYKASPNLYPTHPYILENALTGELVFAQGICPNNVNLPKVQNAKQLFKHSRSQSFRLARNLYKDLAVLILDDQSIWQLSPVESTSQTWKEWWYNIKIEQADPEFQVTHRSWQVMDPIQLYRVDWDKRETPCCQYEKCAYAPIFLIKNRRNGKLAYAKPLDPATFSDLFIELTERAYQDGYSDGYTDGHASCSCSDT